MGDFTAHAKITELYTIHRGPILRFHMDNPIYFGKLLVFSCRALKLFYISF